MRRITQAVILLITIMKYYPVVVLSVIKKSGTYTMVYVAGIIHLALVIITFVK